MIYRNKRCSDWFSSSFFSIRNLEAYKLMPSQEVCAANTVTHYQGPKACVSSCSFIPEVEPTMMICAIEDDVDLANVTSGGYTVNGDFGKFYTWCSVVHTSLLF
jgi:hypothetical protein